MGLDPNGFLAPVIGRENVPRVGLHKLHWFTVRPRDPDVLVIIADGHGLAGRSPGSPTLVNFGEVILGTVGPVENAGPLISDEDLVAGGEAVIVIAGSKEAVDARQFGVIEQPGLGLLTLRRRSK